MFFALTTTNLYFIFRDRKIFSLLLQLKSLVKNNTNAIHQLAGKMSATTVSEDAIEEFMFPMSTINDVNRVDSLLAGDRQKHKLLVRETK